MKTILSSITFITYSLGCRTNQAELEVISDQLSVIGFIHLDSTNTAVEFDSTQYPIPNTNPNIVLINTCMVTSKAERETRKTIRHFRKLYPKAKIVVLGCAVTAKDKFKINLPEADLLISNKEKNKAFELIVDLLRPNSCYSMIHDRGLYCNNIDIDCSVYCSSYTESGRKFIKIQDGCSNCCAFCITTYLRGEPKSEETEKLIELISEFVNSGIKEVVLTGINIGLYGNDLNPPTDIWSLVNRILKETKINRLTLSTVYPEMLYDLRTVLYDTIRNSPRLTRCFHLALQSGSSGILKRMNRPTDLKKLSDAINEIRKIQPDFTFRADVIAGFPDETEEEHRETLKFLHQAKISFAHIFPYSPRVGTMAYEMIQKKKWQEVSPEIKKLRKEEIEKVVKNNRNNQAKKLFGKMFRVLVVREVGGKMEGITDNGWSVLVQNEKCKVQSLVQSSPPKADQPLAEKCKPIKGSFVKVKITGYEKGRLWGVVLAD